MNRKPEVEARLERSLRHQVKAPPLDMRFNAAVWSRIAHDRQAVHGRAPATVPVRHRMPGWLVASNVLAVVVSVVLLGYGAVSSLGGTDLGSAVPELSGEQQRSVFTIVGHVVTVASILFGLVFTRPGRRVIAAWR